MSLFDCGCTRSCTLLAVIASAVVGVIATILQITAAITVTPAFLWVVFGIAVVYLAVNVVIAARRERITTCGGLCSILNAILTGILGTILFSVILLAVTFAATSIVGALIVGLLLFSFALILTSTACLVKCLANCDD